MTWADILAIPLAVALSAFAVWTLVVMVHDKNPNVAILWLFLGPLAIIAYPLIMLWRVLNGRPARESAN